MSRSRAGPALLAAGVLLFCGCRPSPRPGSRPPADPTGPYAIQRKTMVRRQIEARGIACPKVLAALRKVPRHEFCPVAVRSQAYEDYPLPIGHEQTISQPYIVALMTETLRLKPGEKVLEIGTGSGYQAAVLAEITPNVFSIEIVADLARRAAATLAKAGYPTVRVKAGDGYKGWKEHAPFDAIIVTCAPDHVPGPLAEQLAEGGRMVIPVGERGCQTLTLITKTGGKLVKTGLIPVRFVPFTGEAQTRPRPARFGGTDGPRRF